MKKLNKCQRVNYLRYFLKYKRTKSPYARPFIWFILSTLSIDGVLSKDLGKNLKSLKGPFG